MNGLVILAAAAAVGGGFSGGFSGGNPIGPQGVSSFVTGAASTYDSEYPERQRLLAFKKFEQRADAVRQADGGSLSAAHRAALRGELEALARRTHTRLVFVDDATGQRDVAPSAKR